MMHLELYACSCILLVTAVWLITAASCGCLFDAVKPKRITQVAINYDVNPDFTKLPLKKRYHRATSNSSLDGHYKPVRLKAFISNRASINSVHELQLRKVISATLTFVTQLLRVIPVKGPLILGRTGCSRVWQSGENTGKCAHVKPGYVGENCLESFKIPNDHLEGLSVWGYSDTQPVRTVFESGSGLHNTDYVIYVQSSNTHKCIKEGMNIVAYATYCQLDQNGRPLAGSMNICPQIFGNDTLSDDSLAKTLLHEIFHALGFSVDLFAKFRHCRLTGFGNVTCSMYHKPTVRYINDAWRLLTPMVSNVSAHHFGCRNDIDDFGAVLDSLGGRPQSHWNAAFLQGSIMAPSFARPHLVSIDKITLAVFEDSGWYRVNYELADNFVWGRGGGCLFGLNTSCIQADTSPYFCKEKEKGCHHLHMDKATCQTSSFLHNCRLFKADEKDTCLTWSKDVSANNESFSAASRCFMSNITSVSMNDIEPPDIQKLEGHCYQHQCTATGELLVKVFNSTWTTCSYGEYVQVNGYNGVIKCPERGILCQPSRSRNNLPKNTLPSVSDTCSDVPEVTCSCASSAASANTSFIRLGVTFYNIVHSNANMQQLFIDTVRSRLASGLSVCQHSLSNATLLVGERTLYFALALPRESDGKSLNFLRTTLTLLVDSGALTFVLDNSSADYVATSATAVSLNTLSPTSPPADPNGVKVIREVVLNSAAVNVIGFMCYLCLVLNALHKLAV